MRHFLLFFIYLAMLISLPSCYKEEVVYDAAPDENFELPLILRIDNKDCFFDNESSTLRYPIESERINDFTAFIEFQDYSDVYFENELLKNHQENSLGDIEVNTEYQIVVKTSGTTKNISLIFTNLPIVRVVMYDDIKDEPKTIARITVNYPEMDKGSLTSYVGVEYRGASSQSYNKKSLGFSFLNSTHTKDEISRSLFGLRENKDWILDAMYIDKARLRNKVSFGIWDKMEGDKNYGIGSVLVELYLNNNHQGLYCLNEPVNAELLGLYDNDGLLYKAVQLGDGSVRFETYSAEFPDKDYWDGWTQKYPDPQNRINWEPLRALRDLVVNKSDEEFISQIGNTIELDNFIDYYLLLNLVSATDNRGKNTFLTRADKQDAFSIIPWDLDGTFGILWDGTRMGYTEVLSNNLYNRLLELNPENFKSRLKTRWFQLRNSAFSTSELLALFEVDFDKMKRSGVLEIENRKWDVQINLQEEQEYLNNWLGNRVVFLDTYFSTL